MNMNIDGAIGGLIIMIMAMIIRNDYDDYHLDYDGRTEWNVNEDIGGRIGPRGKRSISVNMHNHVNPSNTMQTEYAHSVYIHILCIQ